MMSEEFISDFIEEALNHVLNIEKGLLQLNEKLNNTDVINEIFRAVHSIKGTASFFHFDKIVNLTHYMETLFGKIRNGEHELREKDIDILLSANDCVKELIEHIHDSGKIDIDFHVNNIEKILAYEDSNVDINSIEHKETSLIKCSNSLLKNIDDKIISKAKKSGHRIYVIYVDFDKYAQSIEELNELIDSIGNKLVYHEDSKNNVYYVISTVLEKSLLSIATSVDEKYILECTTENNECKNYENKVKEASKSIDSIDSIIPIKPTGTIETIKSNYSKESKLNTIEQEKEQNSNNCYIEESIRVKLSLLNDLLNITGELVLARNQLLRAMENQKNKTEGIDNIIQNIDFVTSNLQEKIMQTRMQPIANIFDKFPRIVRDLSKELNKNIKLNIKGSEVELDKSIIEGLSDPLTHIVRNAIDHGIEFKDERISKGKSEFGNIKIKAYYKSGYVVVDIIDDGRGIDLENVKRKAVEKEIVSEEDIKHMSEEEVMQLIFKPGFSTAENITDISGRGVGMDVVKSNIKRLGGNVEVYTELNKETTIRLIIPLTLAIISALIVESENEKFAIPQVSIKEIVRIVPGNCNKKIECINNSNYLSFRGRLLPIISLSNVLLNNGYSSCKSFSNEIIRILVLKIGFKEFGLLVDRIYDEEEILVKHVPKYIKDCQCYSGVTILGDGRVAMILDVNGLIEKSKLKLKDETSLDLLNKKNSVIEQGELIRNLLLFKCSKSEMFSLDLHLVKRIEEIKLQNIELVGKKEYINIRGTLVRIICLNNFISISNSENNSEKYYIIFLNDKYEKIGILTNKIYDSVQMVVNYNSDELLMKGVSGCINVNNKLVLVLDVEEILQMVKEEGE